jgi:uncharacterized protein (TIGR03067 family)
MTNVQAAKAVGMQPEQLQRYAKKLGVPRDGGGRWSDADVEMIRLSGRWKILWWEQAGRELDASEGVVVIHGYTFDCREPAEIVGSVAIDTRKRPSWIDVVPTPASGSSRIIRGIYELASEELRMCFAKQGKPRPAKLVSAIEAEMFFVARAV